MMLLVSHVSIGPKLEELVEHQRRASSWMFKSVIRSEDEDDAAASKNSTNALETFK